MLAFNLQPLALNTMPALEVLSKLLDVAVLAVAGSRIWGRQCDGVARTLSIGIRGATEETIEALRIERLILQQLAGDMFEFLAMLEQNSLGLRIGLSEDALNFFVYLLSGLLTAVPLQSAIHTRQKCPVLPVRAADQAYPVAHAENANHLARQCGSML